MTQRSEQRWGRVSAIAASGLIASGCWLVHRVVVEDMGRPADTVHVATPVKAHLLSGQTVVYASGVTVARDSVFGTGTRYDLRLRPVGQVGPLPLDSVLGMESFREQLNVAQTVIYSSLSVAGTIGLGVVIACAADPKCFGSCPLNQLELLEARHGADEVVIPDGQGRLVAVRDRASPLVARDRRGRDLRADLLHADGRVMQTDDRTLAAARLGDLEDTVELEFPAPRGTDSVALVFRMRNSLLNTVLLYDVMLGDAGARSLDWQANDLEQIGPALQVAQWYTSNLGMRIAVWQDGAWSEVAHLRDTGPVAWKDIAAVVPAPTGPTLRVRLSYVVDNWRIDRIAAGFGVRRPMARELPLAMVEDAAGAPDTAALASLRAADHRYLQTSSGQRFSIGWRVPPETAQDSSRTFFLVSQGYYIEWIRRGWLSQPRRGTWPNGQTRRT